MLKKIQFIIAVPSIALLLLSLFIENQIVLFLSMGGVLSALIIRQIRLQKYSYMLGHPARHYDRYGSDRSGDLLKQAETYEDDFEESKTRK